MCVLRLTDGLVDKIWGKKAVRKKEIDIHEIILRFINASYTACPAVADSRVNRHNAKYCSARCWEHGDLDITVCKGFIRQKVICLKLTEEA
jgi:hypothetical protein